MTVERSAHVRSWRGVAAVVLSAGPMEATFLPELGMLGTSLVHEGDELVALPHGVRGYRAGHQTGVPLLAPWANRLGSHHFEFEGVTVDLDEAMHADPNGLPIHGTMTAQPGWEVSTLTPGVLRSVFRYGDHSDLLQAFPFPHDLIVEASLSEEALTVSTTVRATGDRPVPVTFGWHPYLRLPRTPRRSWRLSLPACNHEELDDRSLPTGRQTAQPAEDQVIGDRTFDDLFALGVDRVLAIDDGRRRLAVELIEGYPYAQVYAPPASGFVCLEPMTASIDALSRGDCPTARPGHDFTATYSIVASRPV